jgi:hypothetical protein
MFKIRTSKFRHVFCDQPKQEVRREEVAVAVLQFHWIFFWMVERAEKPRGVGHERQRNAIRIGVPYLPLVQGPHF